MVPAAAGDSAAGQRRDGDARADHLFGSSRSPSVPSAPSSPVKAPVALEVAGASLLYVSWSSRLFFEFDDAAAHALEPGVGVAAVHAQVYNSVRFERCALRASASAAASVSEMSSAARWLRGAALSRAVEAAARDRRGDCYEYSRHRYGCV